MLRIETRASSARSLTRSDQLLALLDRQRRDVEPDHLAVGVGRQAQVAGLDRLDDVADHRRIERADQDLLRLGRAQVGQLLQRRRRAVIVDPDRVDQPRVRPARPDAPELVGQQGHALLHPVFRLEGDLFDAHGASSLTLSRRNPPVSGDLYRLALPDDADHRITTGRHATGHAARMHGAKPVREPAVQSSSPQPAAPGAAGPLLTQVPIGSPATARSMLPSFLKLNTRIGRLFSMHMPIAVMSMTLSCSPSTWS